jgi:hypothetical protein
MRPVPPRRWSKRGSRPALPRLVEPGVHVVRGTPRFEAKLCGFCPARGRGTRVGVTRCLPTGRGPGLRSSLLLVHDPETRRALQFDTLAAVLPIERRDRLEQLLIDDDFARRNVLRRKDDENTPYPARPRRVSYRNSWAHHLLDPAVRRHSAPSAGRAIVQRRTPRDEAGRVSLLLAAGGHPSVFSIAGAGDITKGPVPGDRPLGLPRINPRGDKPYHEGALRQPGWRRRNSQRGGRSLGN